jgi:drug/metabolite transporter (DMT)-like permease
MAFSAAIGFGLIAMLSFGISDFSGKKAAGKFNPLTAAKWDIIFGTIAILVYSIVFVKFPSITTNTWVFIGLAGIFGAVGWIAFYKGLKVANVSIISPIASSWGIVPFILAIVFLSEKLTYFEILFSTVVFIGILFVCLDLKGFNINSKKKLYLGAGLAIIALLGFGFFGFFIVFVVNQVGALYGIVLARLSILVFITIYGLKEKKEKKKFDIKFVWLLIFIGLIDSLGYLAYSFGLATGAVAIVAVIITAAPLVVLLLAHFILKEKLAKSQYLGIVLIILGFVGLALL